MCLLSRSGLSATAAIIFLAASAAWAANEGQDDLDSALRAKVNAKTLSDYSEVIRLSESALSKGLDAESRKIAASLLASTLTERGKQTSNTIFDSLPPDPRWRQFRRVALEDLEKSVKLDPEQPESLLRIAQLNLLPEGDPKRAAEALNQAVRSAKDDPVLQAQALSLRAGLEKDATKKLADLNEAIRVAPGNVASLRARGVTYSQMGKFPEALADFDSALKLQPRHTPTIEAKAMVLAGMKKFDEALAAVEEVAKLEPKSVSPLIQRAQIKAMKPDFTAALKDLDEARRREPANVRVLLFRAAVYQEMKESAKAMADVDKALELRPNLEPAMKLRAMLLAGTGNFHEATKQWEELLKAEPENADNRLRMAVFYSAEQQYEKAIAIYTEIIAKDAAMRWEALRGRGDVQLALGKHAEAVADYEKAYQLRADDAALLNNFSWVLSTSPFDKVRNGKRALEMAKEACRLTDYKRAHILSTLAAAHAELGDFKSAMEWSQKAVALSKAEAAGSGDDQTEALEKELVSYKAGKPIRELKTAESAEKPKPKKPGESQPKTPEKPKAAEKPKSESKEKSAPK